MKRILVCLIVTLLGITAARGAIVVDGTADAEDGPALAWQQWGTLYGDSTLGQVDYANGSELDNAYGIIEDNTLDLVFTGNLESNGNNLDLFIDSRPGGENQLQPQVVNINNFNNMAATNPTNGLAFDTGFAADFWMDVNGSGGPYALYADYLELETTNGYYLGRTTAVSDGTLVGGNNPFGIRVTINNSNTGGVADVACPCTGIHGCHTSAPSVATGIELAIPLAAIGNPAGPIKVFAFINNQTHSYMSNQLMPPPAACDPVPTCGSIPYLPNLGDPRSVNVANIFCGTKYFVVAPPFKPQIAQIAVTGNDVQVGWTTLSGKAYQLQRSATVTGAWINVGSSTNGLGAVITQTDPGGATNQPAQFYRIQQSP